MSSKKHTIPKNPKNSINTESPFGAKTDCETNSGDCCPKTSKSSQESHERHDSRPSHHSNSHIPRYTGRQRRHSDGPSHRSDGCHPFHSSSDSSARVVNNSLHSNHTHDSNGANASNECLIHGIRSPNDMLLYQMLQNLDLSHCQIPGQIRALHRNHVCSNAGQSRSVPTSKLGSSLTTPLSTPSTPTDSRKMSFNRNHSLSQTSTPLRQSKSSLSVISQTTRNTNQKNDRTFAEYMPLCEVQRGLQKGDIVEGVLRINPRNYTDAYISAPEGGLDIYVGGMIDRNRALNGDKVAIHLNKVNDWKVLFDTIRMHWDEWEQPLEQIIESNNKSYISDKIKETPNTSAQSSHKNDFQTIEETIEESDENSEKLFINNESNDRRLSDGIDRQSDGTHAEVNRFDKMSALDESVLSSALTQTCDKNGKKKKRSRSRKKRTNQSKNSGESETKKLNKTTECDKRSLLKPEVFESLITNNKENRNAKKYCNSGHELSEKICRIKTLKIESLLKLQFWRKFVQRTGRVVAITEAIHSRLAGGHLTHMKEKNQNWALFIPNDSRMPRMRIPMRNCPPEFVHHSHHFTQSLFIAQLDEWKTTDHFPSGLLLKYLGNAGDIEAESELILTENQIEFEDFPNEAYFGLPNLIEDEWSSDVQQWLIPVNEFQYRRDFRDQCVFTIDPSTARDLDDALSIQPIDENHFEIGVHIADVSFFLKEGMPLDDIARRRATSVYLVQKVVPMLPRILCEKLCSLNAGEEKLTFSVVWVIDRNGNILKEWFGRSVIKSCIKLSYELAQDMINAPNKQWEPNELPEIYGNWTYGDISQSVNRLNEIAVRLRKCRFESGSLRIDQVKLHFVLDKESGLPSGFSPYLYRDSNRLVEEFMLLANMAVAHKIYKTFGDKAFLRCHPPPAEEALNDFKAFCKYNAFKVDTTSSLSLQQSLDAIVNNDENISKVVAHFLLKSMQAAQYVCVGMQSASQSLHHYALNVPLYTHFTSPIRRYADVIVHRLLAAALSYRPVISESALDLHRLANKCNDKKLSARLVSESSSRLFLNMYVKQIGRIETKGIVVQVFDHSFDVLVLDCGVICRVYMDLLPLKRFVFQTNHGKNQLLLEWIDPNEGQSTQTQTIITCLIVRVQVSVSEDESNKLTAVLQHPNGMFFQNESLRSQKRLTKS